MGNEVSVPSIQAMAPKRYLYKRTADVYFLCGDKGERIPAHKTVLSRQSDAFEAMFYGQLANDSDQNIMEHSPEAFKDFLQFFYYLDEITLRLQFITEVIDLIKKYNVLQYLPICENFLIESFTIEECCLIYGWAIFYEMAEVKDFCENQIRDYPRLVFETSSFLRCDHIVFDNILKLDGIVCDEPVILKACLNWARNKCEQNGLHADRMKNLRQYIMNSIYRIRFGSLKSENLKKYADIAELFEDPADYGHVNRLVSGVRDANNERFHLGPRFVAEWEEIPNKRMFCTFATTKRFTLKGIYFAPVMKKPSNLLSPLRNVPVINTLINRNGVSFKMMLCKRLEGKKTCNAFHEVIFKPNEIEECYVDLSAHDITIAPEFIYSIALKASNKCYSYFPVIGQRSWGFRQSCAWAIQLDDDTRISCNGKSIIRSFSIKRPQD